MDVWIDPQGVSLVHRPKRAYNRKRTPLLKVLLP